LIKKFLIKKLIKMKKLILILTVLYALFLTSCEVESSDSAYPRTLKGKVTYDATQEVIYQSIYLLDLITKVDFYAEAPSDEQEGIKNLYLRDYAITYGDNSWIVENDYHQITLSHNGKSINERGGIWTLKLKMKMVAGDNNIPIDNENFRIESSGDKDWKLITDHVKSYHISQEYLHYTDKESSSGLYIKGIKAAAKSPNIYDFKIEKGSGNIDNVTHKFDYTITEPVTYTSYSSSFAEYIPISGIIYIISGEEKTEATIMPNSVRITFGEVTEIY